MSPLARVANASLPKAPASRADVDKMLRAATATGLPGISESLWFNRPTLKVGGKWLICARQAGVYVIFCPMIEKEHLIERAPATYFDTDHHRNSAAVLAWVRKASVAELTDRIARAWRLQAPKTLQRAWDGVRVNPPPSPRAKIRRRKAVALE